MIHNQTPPPPHPPTGRHRNAGPATEAHTPHTPNPHPTHAHPPTSGYDAYRGTRRKPQGPVLPGPNSVFAAPPPTHQRSRQPQQVFNDEPRMSDHETHNRRLH